MKSANRPISRQALQLAPEFPRLKTPGTGRTAVQLTSGKDFCYPLYYFIPTFTNDGRYLIHHRSDGRTVQLHRLELATAQSVPMTRAHAPPEETHWQPWDMPAGAGVLDHRSVLNVVQNEVVYFDGNDVRVVDVESLADRSFFQLPPDRIAIGQNCVSDDGCWFIYIHHDRKTFLEQKGNVYDRHVSRGVELRARHFDTGEERLLVRLNSPIHHVIPYGRDQFVFCHPATEQGMLLTDLRGGWYSHLCTQDADGLTVCHYLSTARGIAYEAWCATHQVAGLYDPATHRRREFRLPADWGYTHTGADPEGRLWFFETQRDKGATHELMFLQSLEGDRADWQVLTGDWPAFGSGQKSHFHPRLTPDRQWITLVAGDPATQTNHIFLMDVSDLPDTDLRW